MRGPDPPALEARGSGSEVRELDIHWVGIATVSGRATFSAPTSVARPPAACSKQAQYTSCIRASLQTTTRKSAFIALAEAYLPAVPPPKARWATAIRSDMGITGSPAPNARP